jgi:hypothetical protein
MRISGELSRKVGAVTLEPDNADRFLDRARPIGLLAGSPDAVRAGAATPIIRDHSGSAATTNPTGDARTVQRTGTTVSPIAHAAVTPSPREMASHTENTGGTP